jgi:hypothetical protein
MWKHERMKVNRAKRKTNVRRPQENELPKGTLNEDGKGNWT